MKTAYTAGQFRRGERRIRRNAKTANPLDLLQKAMGEGSIYEGDV